MRVIDDNARKIGLAIILAGLMIVIIGFGKYFEESLKIATLTQNNMLEFEKYEILEGKIKYELPKEWLTTVVKDDNEIYLNEFISLDAETYGFVQLIEQEGDFAAVTNLFKEEIKDMGINDLRSEEVKINDCVAEVVEYTFKYSDKKSKKTYEYYLPYDKYVVKVSFTISDSKMKENTKVVFENIVKTFSFN